MTTRKKGPDPLNLVGTTIKNYQVISSLKSGAEAAVYLVKDTISEVRYAMKVFFPETNAERFYLQELYAYKILSEEPDCLDLVVCLKEGFEEKISSQIYYILILELMLGDLADFQRKVEKIGNYPVRLVEFMKVLLEGLQSIHHRFIVHGDIKLGNILYKKEEGEYVFKFGDLGLSCTSSEYQVNLSFPLKQCFSGTGSVFYMSPSKAQDIKKGLSRRIISVEEAQKNDVWALGVIFRLLATRTYPFEDLSPALGLTRNEILDIISEDEVKPSSYAWGNKILDSLVNTVIDGMNQRDEEARWTIDKALTFLRENTKFK